MQKKKILAACGAAVLVLAVLAAALCFGNPAAASTIRLMRLEGTLEIADEGGKAVSSRENMMIYSGYQLATAPVSYAWMNLDDVKLAKMDEDSEIRVGKSGKDLEILVDRGGFYFNVTESLTEEETMTVRTSTMAVGIRGTSGWVRVDSPQAMAVYILEGTVACTVRDPDSGEEKTDTVSGGEMALLTLNPQGEAGQRCQIVKEKFSPEDIPAFVREELDQEPPEASGSGGADYDPADLDPMNAVSNGRFELDENYWFRLTWDEPANLANIQPEDGSGRIMYTVYLKDGDDWVTGGESLMTGSWGIEKRPCQTSASETWVMWPTYEVGSYSGVKIETVIMDNTTYEETVVGVYEDLSLRLEVTRAEGPAVPVTLTRDEQQSQQYGTDYYTREMSGLTPNTYHWFYQYDGGWNIWGEGGNSEEDGTCSRTTGAENYGERLQGDYLVIEFPNPVVSDGGKTASYTVLKRGDWTKISF